jgi:hypothetical protein
MPAGLDLKDNARKTKVRNRLFPMPLKAGARN